MSHPAENPSGTSGVASFTNGPVLSDDAYPTHERKMSPLVSHDLPVVLMIYRLHSSIP